MYRIGEAIISRAMAYPAWMIVLLLTVLAMANNAISQTTATETAGSTRYIDFTAGKDSNPGTRQLPWKHHPWDPQARGRASTDKTAHTYIFKRGVIYRGALVSRFSGTPTRPIMLTSDPSWGEGEAILSGAEPVTGQWYPCTHTAPSQVYCVDIPGKHRVTRLWQGSEDTRPLILARYPNPADIHPYDMRAAWPEIERRQLEVEITLNHTRHLKPGDTLALHVEGKKSPRFRKTDLALRWNIQGIDGNRVSVLAESWPRRGIRKGDRLTANDRVYTVRKTTGTHALVRRIHDPDMLGASGTGDLSGAILQVERPDTQQLTTALVEDNNPDKGYLRSNLHLAAVGGPKKHDRYLLSGLPGFIDSPGEFSPPAAGERNNRLYLMPHDGKVPPAGSLEYGARPFIIKIAGHKHITISSLTLRHTDMLRPGTRQARLAPHHSGGIIITANASGITLSNSRLEHLEYGISAYPSGGKRREHLDHITIRDNVFRHINGSAIALGSGIDRVFFKKKGRLGHVTVQDNAITDSGFAPLAQWALGSQGHAIDIVGGEVVEVSANRINRVGGSGINVYLGSQFRDSGLEHPFLRGLIHHNHVEDSLLGVQDFGGIESWLGGPMYIFNNTSINPVGYRHGRYRRGEQKGSFKQGSYGVGYYLDGQYKGYVFNNVATGHNNNINDPIYSAAGFNEASGFLNTVFGNRFRNFAVGIHKGLYQHNRGKYIDNTLTDIGYSHILQEARDQYIEHQTLAYANNRYHGQTKFFAHLGRKGKRARTLKAWQKRLSDHGVMAADTGSSVIATPTADTEHKTDSRVFVPWALARVVGEWHFLESAVPATVHDEAINMNSMWLYRSMFHDIPRHDLACNGVAAGDYRPGTLESWTDGSLRFNGKRSCRIADSDMRKPAKWKDSRSAQSGIFQPRQRDTLDIDTDSFIIELVMRIDKDATNTGVLAKRGDAGYALALDSRGVPTLLLDWGNTQRDITAGTSINDGQWHHLLVEYDNSRETATVNFYLDGRPDSQTALTDIPADSSLENTADFMVGQSAAGYLRGSIDFLRIARSTLTDAETDIDELYRWEIQREYEHNGKDRP